jgi:hypothetical protein
VVLHPLAQQFQAQGKLSAPRAVLVKLVVK